MKYIDADRLRAEIEKLYNGEVPAHDSQCNYGDGYFTGISRVFDIIDSLQEEQPEYGYLSTMYNCGKNPRWNVGDTLAYYICTSNEEGEFIIGKVKTVEFDKDVEDWIYTFENEDIYTEEELRMYEVYTIG